MKKIYSVCLVLSIAISILLTPSAQAHDFSQFPPCTGSKKLQVPEYLQGVYKLGVYTEYESERASRVVVAEDGLVTGMNGTGAYVDGKLPLAERPDVDLVSLGFCLDRDMKVSENGDVRIWSTLKNGFEKPYGVYRDWIISKFIYDAQEKKAYLAQYGGSFLFLFWVVPFNGGSWEPGRLLEKLN